MISINNKNLLNYFKCEKYICLEKIYKQKRLSETEIYGDTLDNILNQMFDNDGNDLIKKNFSNHEILFNNAERIIKNIFKSNVETKKELSIIYNNTIVKCVYDFFIREENKNIFIKVFPKIYKNKMIKDNELSEEIISLCFYKLINEYEEKEQKKPTFLGFFLKENCDNEFGFFQIVDLTNNVNIVYEKFKDIFLKICENANKKELYMYDIECKKKNCKFYNICLNKKNEIIEQEYINISNLDNEIKKIKYPIGYLDFETCSYSYPKYKGFKPYQKYPFMYSLIIQTSDSKTIERKYYIAPDNQVDYRRQLFKSLIKDCERCNSIVVYNEIFEKNVISEGIKYFNEFAEDLKEIDSKIIDLMYIIKGNKSNKKENYFKNNYYNTKQNFSYSLKKVFRLFDETGYSKVKVKNGEEASLIFENIHKYYDKEVKLKELIEYCQLDTEAMYIILNKLKNKIKKDC